MGIRRHHLIFFITQVQKRSQNEQASDTFLLEGNGHETWQSSLLNVFADCLLGADPVQNLAKYKMWYCVFIPLTN